MTQQFDLVSRLDESPFDPVEERTSRIGEVLGGKYELVRKLGEGGMGEVYEARHLVLGRRFAIKLLHPELVRSSRMLRRFTRESLNASRIESAHVVAVLDCGQLPGGAPYFVMEYLRGRDLRGVLREAGRLHVPRAVRLVRQVCRGLQSAHELGLVHRDLKPENIFVERKEDGTECAKILDFGVVQTDGGNSTAQTGALIGTMRYMAPEQARGDARLDQRADLYALGAILYECLAGVVPHPGQNTEEILFHIMSQEPAPLHELRPELSPGLQDTVRRSLERDLDRRFQSALEFADALLAHVGDNPDQVQGSVSFRSDEETSSDSTSVDDPPVARRRRDTPLGGPFAQSTKAWIVVALFCGSTVHVVDRAWLREVAPNKVAPKTQGTVSMPPIGYTRPTAIASNGSGLEPPPTTVSSVILRPGTDLNTRPIRKVATPKKLPAADYRANLDWKNPYDSAAPAKQ